MRVLWLTIVVSALLGGAFFLWTRDTRAGAQAPEYSVRRTDERGAALVYRLFEQSGIKPQPWDRDFTNLNPGSAAVSPGQVGLMILIAPAEERRLGATGPAVGSVGDLLPPEVVALDEWVRRGNTAVILGRQRNPLYRALGLIVDEPEGGSKQPAEPVQPGVLAAGVNALQTQSQFGFKFGRPQDPLSKQLGVPEAPEPIEAIPAEEWVTLFAKTPAPDKGGSADRPGPQVVAAARGKGLYVAVNDSFPASNLGLPQADNARFALNLAALNPPGGTIWFDEYHRRTVDRGLVAYLRERGLAPVLLYGALLLALGLWRAGTRFGEPEPLVADRWRDSREYVQAVAALYRNAGMTRDALGTLLADFRRRAARPGSPVDAEVGRRYEQRTRRPAGEARQILADVEAAIERSHLPETEAVHVAARLAALDRVLRAHGPR